LADSSAKPSNVVSIQKDEAGISGTNNWSGKIYAEANSKLQWERAYGTPGSQTWGEWEKLERTDHAVAAALNLLASPLRDASIDIEPADSDEQSIKIADFVRDNFQEWLEPRWPTLIEQMVRTGVAYGFSIHEIVWGSRQDERVPGGQAFFVKKLAQRLPSSVMSDGWKVEGGELKSIRQSGLRDGKWETNIDLPADKVVLATWNRNGDNFQGFSAFRPVWYLATMRADLLRIIAIGHQREALGVPVAERDLNATLTDEQQDELQEMLESSLFHENAAIVLPAGVSINWVFSAGANKGQVLETWKQLGLAILETVQAQQLFLGTSNTGSRAVGDTHDGTKNDFVAGIRAWLEGVLNGIGSQPYTGIVRKLVDLNFGPQKKYPFLSLVVKRRDLGASELANAVKVLKDAGALTITENDENELRDRLGLSPIDPEERAAERERARQVQPSAPEQQKSDAGPETKTSSDSPQSDEIADGHPSRPGRSALSEGGFVPARLLREEERHLALGEMDSFHTNARLEFERDAKDILQDIIRGALPAVRDAMADGDPSELNGWNPDTKLLSKMVEVFIERARAFGYRQAANERKRQPAIAPKSKKQAEALNKGLPFAALSKVLKLEEDDRQDPTAPSLPDVKVDKLVKAQTQLVTNKIKARLKQQIQDYAIDAVRTGESADDVIDDVLEDIEESKTLRSDAGLVTARSFAMGREQFATEHGDEVTAVRYSAVLDKNTCGPCAAADGSEFEFNSAEHDEYTPPYRDCDGWSNCRCLLIYVFEKDGFHRDDE